MTTYISKVEIRFIHETHKFYTDKISLGYIWHVYIIPIGLKIKE